MQKPIIGLIPLVDEEKESYWMLPGYMQALEEAGAIPLMLPLCCDEKDLRQLLVHLDGILFTGGHDVNPKLYGETALPTCGAICARRDTMEQRLFQLGMAQNIPMLGICRGIQFLNVMCGGTLYQDLPTQHVSNTEHHQTPPYDQPVHKVQILPNTPLHDLLQTEILPVNSYHHQAIKTLGSGLKAMAVSEDGLVEAVFLPEKRFVWAVQWHPEFSFATDENSRKIMQRFADCCKKAAP